MPSHIFEPWANCSGAHCLDPIPHPREPPAANPVVPQSHVLRILYFVRSILIHITLAICFELCTSGKFPAKLFDIIDYFNFFFLVESIPVSRSFLKAVCTSKYLCHYLSQRIRGGTHIGKWYGMCRGHDPLFYASRHSLAYQFTINAPLICPPFQFLEKISIFSLVLVKMSALKMQIFQIFVLETPHFSRKIRFLDPTFGNPCGTHPPKKC